MPKDYASSVGNYLARLRIEYKDRVQKLKYTGTGDEDGFFFPFFYHGTRCRPIRYDWVPEAYCRYTPLHTRKRRNQNLHTV